MLMRALRHFALTVIVLALLPPASASEQRDEIASRVAVQGMQMHEAMQASSALPQSPLLSDAGGKLNIAETNLNWAAALLTTEGGGELARQVIAAALEHQDIVEGSATRGLFRWFADPGEAYSADATLYLAPTLAHLAQSNEVGNLRGRLQGSSRLALTGFMNMNPRPRDGYGGAMWAGAVLSLASVVGDEAAARAGAATVQSTLAALRRSGPGSVHSPTFDALRIGGLRWAWQHAPDDQTRMAAEAALGICYADMLQRYDPEAALVTGAIGEAYAADYLGTTGVAIYLLAADLPSALASAQTLSPLAMYFALSQFSPHEDLIAIAEGDAEIEVRTRIPDPEGVAPEKAGTVTWRRHGLSLGTMSGVVGDSSIPIMATSDLPERPTSYFYTFGGGASLHSVQAGPLAICSFDFDGVGVGRRAQVGLRGVLGQRDQIDRVVVSGSDWIGEPRAIGHNGSVVLRRGNSYLGVKILETGPAGAPPAATKPGRLEWFAEGSMDTLLLTISGRSARYALPEPIYDVRVGLLIEVAPVDQFESLDEFAAHITGRRVSQQLSEERQRVDTVDERQIPGRHEPRTLAEMRFARFLNHRMALVNEELPLALVHEMRRNQLVSRTLPVELPEGYLWVSPALTLTTAGSAGSGATE